MNISETEQKFNKLIYENQAILHKICHVYCEVEADREDLFQEMIINLWKGFASFKRKASFSTWMYRVALNTAISQTRKRKKRFWERTTLEKDVAYEENKDKQEKEIQLNALYSAIRQLKKVERAIILLYLEEKSYQEIAEITGLSKSNVSVKLVRIKLKLEKIVKSILSKS